MSKKSGNPRNNVERAVIEQGSFHLDENAEWGGFLNIRLTDEQKALFYDWYAENAAVSGQIMDELLGDGMKISFSYDRENQCYICAFTGRMMKHDTKRYVMSTRASTLTEVIALSTWKHVFLAQGDYGQYMPKRQNFANWG